MMESDQQVFQSFYTSQLYIPQNSGPLNQTTLSARYNQALHVYMLVHAESTNNLRIKLHHSDSATSISFDGNKCVAERVSINVT